MTELGFLGVMDKIVMRHLETNREANERRRGIKMSRGLSAFVEGKTHLANEWDDQPEEGESSVNSVDSVIARSTRCP